MATPPPQLNVSSLSMEQYHKISDEAMDTLLEELEVIIEDNGDPSYEVEYHSGVLTLKLGDTGTYVINKQPPNKQIWLSSPFSGPKRYDYDESDGSWRYSRDNKRLDELLNEELGRTFTTKIQLTLSSK
ncbi:Frataxin [Rhodocollybia butyracea]|uniref:ferroxidase n=1 Tax=Rhodocollybia butyracea TaxID=206335 RepID=A0A9P5UB55_9AGAR|nr:Frataxin [Rhodocollybia butyracea]